VKVIFPLFIPNTFTPNGDGVNEIFKTYSEILDKYELLIYDRWGNLAFQTSDLSSGWNGEINGEAQPQDVYVYKLRYVLRHTQEWKEKVGIVSLIR
jgi:gliding motility-associated-like protein